MGWHCAHMSGKALLATRPFGFHLHRQVAGNRDLALGVFTIISVRNSVLAEFQLVYPVSDHLQQATPMVS